MGINLRFFNRVFQFLGIGLCCFLLNGEVKAQMIDNTKANALKEGAFFNRDFIRYRGIKEIAGKFIHYKLGDKLRETGYYKKFFFDRNGRVIKVEEKSLFTTGQENAVDIYDYDANGNLILHRHYDHYTDFVYHFSYDENNRMVTQEFRQKYHKGELNGDALELGDEYIIFSEEYAYKEFDGQLHQIVFYKNADSPYKDVITYYNEDGEIKEIVGKLKRSSTVKTTAYYYNDAGLVDSTSVNSKTGRIINTSASFQYDQKRNLKSRKDYYKGELETKYEVIYKEETKLINDILIQDVKTNFIQILELRNYKYFGKDD